MNLSLQDKHALVCGSSKGIGKASAIELAKLGAAITLVARNHTALETVKAELSTDQNQQHQILIADFNEPEALSAKVKAHIQLHGPVHILINNTGGPPGGAIVNAETGAFLKAYRMHLLCNHLLAQAVIPGMTEAEYGRIINVISTSVKQPIPGLGVSNTTRGAVASWAKTLASELGPFGITVNNVLPGYTQTERLEEIIQSWAQKQGKTEDEIIEGMQAGTPARRFASPEETAFAVAFLASPSAAYINGINLPVDGGRTSCL